MSGERGTRVAGGADPSLLAEALAVRDRARLVVAAPDVNRAIGRMADEIGAVLRDRAPVVLAVMQGGAFTAVELCKHFRFPYEFDYVHVSSYGRELTGGALEWHVRPRVELAGRTVLLVDDVLDRGATLAALIAELEAAGVEQLYTAVLAVKHLEEALERPAVDFKGVDVGAQYLFGCGMDYNGYWRGLPELYAKEESWQPT